MSMNELAISQLVDDRIGELRSSASRRRVAPVHTRRLPLWSRLRSRRTGASATTDAVSASERPPAPFSDEFGRWANAVGAYVAEHGVRAVERPIATLVRHARRHQLSATVVDVLADRDAPPVARERALGAVLTALAGSVELELAIDTSAA